MNKVTVNSEEIPLPTFTNSLINFAQKVMDIRSCKNWDLSVLLCGDKTIKALNAKYRNKDEPTDILSFNLGETAQIDDETVYLPGDIVISLESMRHNAQYFKINEDEELRRLIIHGILHLEGMNHETIDKDEPMLVIQEDILNKLKDETILHNGGEK